MILVGPGGAVFQCCRAVPANRIGHGGHGAAAWRKGIRAVIALTVFAVFSKAVPKESLGWNTVEGFGFTALGAAFVFRG